MEKWGWAAIGGLMTSLALLGLGYAIGTQGYLDVSPYGGLGQVIIGGVLGVTFGYYLARTTSHSAATQEAGVFLAALLGSFVVLLGTVALGGLVSSSTSIPGFSSGLSLATLLVLVACTLIPYALVNAGLTDIHRLHAVGKSVTPHVKQLAASTLGGYATASVTGSNGWWIGIGIGILVFVGLFLLSPGGIEAGVTLQGGAPGIDLRVSVPPAALGYQDPGTSRPTSRPPSPPARR